MAEASTDLLTKKCETNERDAGEIILKPVKKKLCGPSPQANYTYRATTACQRSSWSVTDPYGRILGFLDLSRYYFFQVAPQLYSRG
jgi:hypothetical protein